MVIGEGIADHPLILGAIVFDGLKSRTDTAIVVRRTVFSG